jgi:predicted transcriptional regulator of viral defense system
MNDYSRYNTLEEFANGVRAMGRYAFALDEVKKSLELSDKALNQALFRLKKKNKLAQIRKSFFAIIPPEYSKQGMLPPHLFIDDLMKWLGKRYYVGLFSAAALYGAAHQQPMEYYVITEKPALRNIKSSKLNINFYVKKDWVNSDLVQTKTDAGYMEVSSPELTALDLLTYGNFGLNRVVTILEELVEEIKPSVLARTAKSFSQTTTIQRLGYIIDKEIGNEKLGGALKKILKERTIYPIPLLKNAGSPGVLDRDWKIVKNTEIESDL